MRIDCELLSKQASQLKDVFYQPATKEVKVESFTVGQKIDWQCRGGPLENSQEWTLKVQGEAKESAFPIFKIVNKEWQDASTLNLSLRFYQVNEKPWQLEFKKAEQKIPLNGLEAKVTSVLPFHELTEEKENEQGEMMKQPAPYPMTPALKMNYPIAMWIYLVLSISLIGGYLARKWYKNRKLKRFATKIANEQHGRNPMQDFYKSLRALYHFKGSDADYLKTLQTSYFDYLQSRFYMPFADWSAKEIYKTLKREHQELSDHTLHATYHNLSEVTLLAGKEVEREKLKHLVEDIQMNVEDLDKNARRPKL